MTQDTTINHENLVKDIWENFFNYDLHTYRLDLFINAIETIRNRHIHELSFLDTLFLEDISKECALSSIVKNNGHELFVSLLDKYKNEFQVIEPKKWDFIFWTEENQCHNHLLNFYGKDYFENILDPKHYNFTGYSHDFFSKYYLSGQLDNSFTLNNLKNCHQNYRLNMVHALNFYNENKEEFKKFILDTLKKPKSLEDTNLKFHRFIYLTRRGRNPVLNSSTDNKQTFHISLPSVDETDLLLKKWGVEKTSEILSEYLNFQKTCLDLFEHKEKIVLSSDLMEHFIEQDIQFKNCGEVLALGLKTESDLLSYFIINGSISKEDMLNSMEDGKLYKKAHCVFLNETLGNSSNQTKKMKI